MRIALRTGFLVLVAFALARVVRWLGFGIPPSLTKDFSTGFAVPLFGGSAFDMSGLEALSLLFVFSANRFLDFEVTSSRYSKVYARIDRTLDALVGTVRSTQGPAKVTFQREGIMIASDGRATQTDTPPLDPRAVERMFLEVLREAQDGSVGFAFGPPKVTRQIAEHAARPAAPAKSARLISVPVPQVPSSATARASTRK